MKTIEDQLPVDARDTSVYSYATQQRVRWRVAVNQPDGTVTTRRGYRSNKAACRARDRLAHAEPPDEAHDIVGRRTRHGDLGAL